MTTVRRPHTCGSSRLKRTLLRPHYSRGRIAERATATAVRRGTGRVRRAASRASCVWSHDRFCACRFQHRTHVADFDTASSAIAARVSPRACIREIAAAPALRCSCRRRSPSACISTMGPCSHSSTAAERPSSTRNDAASSTFCRSRSSRASRARDFRTFLRASFFELIFAMGRTLRRGQPTSLPSPTTSPCPHLSAPDVSESLTVTTQPDPPPQPAHQIAPSSIVFDEPTNHTPLALRSRFGNDRWSDARHGDGPVPNVRLEGTAPQ